MVIFLYVNVCVRRNNKTFRVKNESPPYPVYLWTHIELCNLNQHVRGSRVNKGEKCHSNPFVETLNALNLSIRSRNTECYSHELFLPPGGGEWSCFWVPRGQGLILTNQSIKNGIINVNLSCLKQTWHTGPEVCILDFYWWAYDQN